MLARRRGGDTAIEGQRPPCNPATHTRKTDPTTMTDDTALCIFSISGRSGQDLSAAPGETAAVHCGQGRGAM